MPKPEFTPLYDDLDFNRPLSDERAAAIVASLQPLDGQRIVDLGCGWGELADARRRVRSRATGVGVDLDANAIHHGRPRPTLAVSMTESSSSRRRGQVVGVRRLMS